MFIDWHGICLLLHSDIGFRVIATCLTRAGMTSLQAECSRRITVCLMDVTDSESITVARQHVEEILPDGLGK